MLKEVYRRSMPVQLGRGIFLINIVNADPIDGSPVMASIARVGFLYFIRKKLSLLLLLSLVLYKDVDLLR